MRLALCVLLLIAIVVTGANAEWYYWKAKPQKFQVFGDYVMAVGTRDKLEPVQASDIVKALEDGKEIRLYHIHN